MNNKNQKGSLGDILLGMAIMYGLSKLIRPVKKWAERSEVKKWFADNKNRKLYDKELAAMLLAAGKKSDKTLYARLEKVIIKPEDGIMKIEKLIDDNTTYYTLLEVYGRCRSKQENVDVEEEETTESEGK